ncbi:helix-turn-helix transcriptional regulator [Pedobacter sp. Hv1]|uniref:helix-turn-helix transcriptional regulator n=1 Tax=Pedobacter sp. Hv1 TaxID=1740090 RepID=UPI0006D8A181|nr:helix-turn-helix transcriptional regulator [Pedobacter sp. Hv1]KQB99264.1 hypothetical protein AQF98_16955 [Pedobacter sp. Hv1]
MKNATGKVIKAVRKHFNYKQEFLANKLHVTLTTLANIENGRVGLDLEKLYRLSLIFRVRAGDILKLIIEIFENGNEEALNSALKISKRIPSDED